MAFEIDIQQWFLVFSAVFVSDVCWTYCITRVNNYQALKAGVWGGAFYLSQGLATQGFTDHKILLIPATIGAVVGTALTVWWEKKQREKRMEKMVAGITPENKHPLV